MFSMLFALLAAGPSSPGAVPLTPSTNVTSLAIPHSIAFNLFKQQMTALRQDALDQTAQDGGTLTAQHKQDIQSRIDHIEKIYHDRTTP